MDYPYVRSSSKRRVAVDGVYVVNSSWVETGRLTSPCTACWNKIRSWVGWTFLDVKKSKKSYPSFSQGMLLLCSPIKGEISVVFRNQGIQFGLKIHHGVERSVKEQRNMLIYWLFDWLVIASYWNNVSFQIQKTFLQKQPVLTSTRRRLPPLIVWDRQAVSPITCQLWQTSHSLQFEGLAEQCQMIFQNSFEHPMVPKTATTCISFHRCNSHWFELEGYLRTKRSQQNYIPQISKKKRTEKNIISGKSLAQHPSLWKILQFFQGILVTESTSATSPQEKMPCISFVEAMGPTGCWVDKCWQVDKISSILYMLGVVD